MRSTHESQRAPGPGVDHVNDGEEEDVEAALGLHVGHFIQEALFALLDRIRVRCLHSPETHLDPAGDKFFEVPTKDGMV